jgi:hypothetical protein
LNASASAIPREDEVQSKIRKVRQFGRIARVVCAAIFGFGLVGSLALLLIFVPTHIPGPIKGNGGAYELLAGLLTPLQLKWAVSLGTSILAGVWLAAVYQLYRLFGNLAVGAIYTPENVRRVRNVGLLFLLLAVLAGIVLPAALVFAHGFFDASVPIDLERLFPSLPELLGDFVSPGLILLASWIMDVGLYEKDHADALRRDADLVI